MSTVKTTFVLTGPLAGQTVNLGSLPYRFAEGRTTIIAPMEEMPLHAQFLERNWQAYPEGHDALKETNDGQRDIQSDPAGASGDLQPNGEGAAPGTDAAASEGDAGPEAVNEAGGLEPEGDGQAPQLNEKLRKAVLGLDPADDSHWTKEGKPAMTAVEKLYGSSGLTRADVDAAAPGFTREKAKAAV